MIAPAAGPITAATTDRNCTVIKVNRHKHGYNGKICMDPARHQCGASDNFRLQKCARNLAECYDMNIFNAQEPLISRKLNYDGSELLEHVQQGDLLFFWTYQNHGSLNSIPILAGLYVVDAIDVETYRPELVYTFFPRKDRMLQIDFMFSAEKLLSRAIGGHRWTRQLPISDVPWALGEIHQAFQEQAKRAGGYKSYEQQLDLLDDLMDEFGGDNSNPLYQKLLQAGALQLELAPAAKPRPATPAPVSTKTPKPILRGLEPPATRLTQVAASYQLHYPERLLTRFHISLSTQQFVILTGHSGTGKTQLSRVYAEAEDAVYGLIKVQPDWVSPSYLWGAYDYLASAFAPTEFTQLVCEAAEEWDRARAEGRAPQQYVLTLDEMNLARVEYYLADILSAMEQPVDQRIINLYSSSLPDKSGFPSRVRFTPNIRLVGTINVDETTHSLSPKVLDRAHVIRLDYVELMELRNLLEFDEPDGDHAVLNFVFLHLEEVRRRMADDPTQQFGYRVARQIFEWVRTATQPPYNLPLETALDAEISQKILPRLRVDPDSSVQMAMFDKLLSYFEQYEQHEPGFNETLRWLRSRHEQLSQSEAISGQQ